MAGCSKRIAQERLVEGRRVDGGPGSLHDSGVATEVVGVGVRRQNDPDFATELLAHGLEGLLGARLVEPGVD